MGSSPEEQALHELATSLGPTTLPSTTAAATAAATAPGSTAPKSPGLSLLHPPSTVATSAGSLDAVFDVGGNVSSANRASGGGQGSGDQADMPPGGATLAESQAGVDDGRIGGWAFGSRGNSAASGGKKGEGVARRSGGGRGERGGTGLGLKQRLASAVGRIRGGVGSETRATQAYLGVENKFRYDGERRVWVMEGDSGEEMGGVGDISGGGREKGSLEVR